MKNVKPFCEVPHQLLLVRAWPSSYRFSAALFGKAGDGLREDYGGFLRGPLRRAESSRA
jgi:hypothetical protein